MAHLDWEVVDNIIENALQEDLGSGDVTSNALFGPEERALAYLMSKAEGVLAGLPVAERVFRKLDPGFTWDPKCREGQRIGNGSVIAVFEGTCRALLSGERLALNILQRLSGIATLTAQFVEAVAGLPVKILDTRKTLPGLRVLEKYAVALGGGTNHRFGLYDGIMIKDNHIRLAGGIRPAVEKIRRANLSLPVEVETTTLEEVQTALAAGADIIMLDNMDNATMRRAVQLIAGRAITEASGGVNLQTVRGIAQTGVDTISVGALTHSAPALDIGMYIR